MCYWPPAGAIKSTLRQLREMGSDMDMEEILVLYVGAINYNSRAQKIHFYGGVYLMWWSSVDFPCLFRFAADLCVCLIMNNWRARNLSHCNFRYFIFHFFFLPFRGSYLFSESHWMRSHYSQLEFNFNWNFCWWIFDQCSQSFSCIYIYMCVYVFIFVHFWHRGPCLSHWLSDNLYQFGPLTVSQLVFLFVSAAYLWTMGCLFKQIWSQFRPVAFEWVALPIWSSNET